MLKKAFICHSCGKRIEYTSEEPPCKMLSGWLIVSQWKGLGVIEHHNFCSFTCVKSWTDAQISKIPDVFVKAFEEGKDT